MSNLMANLQKLADRLESMLPRLETEEATKTALVLPVIAALGCDIFDPSEVVPEFTADVGLKKGEKVDYPRARSRSHHSDRVQEVQRELGECRI